AGAPGWLCGTAVGVGWLHEYLRERAAAGVLAVTVAERPTRVLCAFFALIAATAAGWTAPGMGRWAVTLAVAGWLAVGVIALSQLGRALGETGIVRPAA